MTMRRTLWAGLALTAISRTDLAMPEAASAQTLRIGLRRGPRHARSDAGAHLCRPHRVRRHLRQAVRHRRRSSTSCRSSPPATTGRDPKTLVIHLRPGVMFQDGEPFDAEAVKYTLERAPDLPGQHPARRDQPDRPHRRRRSADACSSMLKAPFSPLLAQLTDRAGMIVSPKAAEAEGDNSACIRSAPGPTSSSSAWRRTTSCCERSRATGTRTNDPFRSRGLLPIVDTSVRLANLQAGALDFVEYVAADRRGGGARRIPSCKLAIGDGLGYQRHHHQHRTTARAREPDRPERPGAPGVRPGDRPRGADPGGLQRHVSRRPCRRCRPPRPFYDAELQPPPRDVAKAQGAAEAGRRRRCRCSSTLMVTNPDRSRPRGDPVDGGGSRVRHEYQVDGVRLVAGGGEGRRYQAYMIGWSGRVDPDGNIYAFLHSKQA